ncbi:MAG: DUF2752 domain-containing protein [Nocardioidaceae bacterium]
MRLPVLVGAAGLAATVLLHFRDPHAYGSYGLCPFHFLTGLWCPGCGGLRAVNDLTGLDVGAAVSSNVLAVVLVAGLGMAYLLWLPRRWRGDHRPLVRPGPRAVNRTVTLAVAAIVVFTVVRNTPWGTWLAP